MNNINNFNLVTKRIFFVLVKAKLSKIRYCLSCALDCFLRLGDLYHRQYSYLSMSFLKSVYGLSLIHISQPKN